jgi:proteasome lid subunit RPN8/RPN11
VNAIIKIHKVVIQQLIKHACMDVYRECGGYLLGTFRESDNNIQFIIYGIYYEKRLGSETSFLFSPIYEYNATRYQESQNNSNLQLIGSYHSHAQYPAIFSPEDRVLQQHWGTSKCTLIYSPKTNELIGDIMTSNGISISSRITLFGQEEMAIQLPKLTPKPSQKTLKI